MTARRDTPPGTADGSAAGARPGNSTNPANPAIAGASHRVGAPEGGGVADSGDTATPAGARGPRVAGAGEEDRRAWSRPGVYPVAPGIHRIPLPLPTDALRAVNVYVVADGDGVVVIDSGWALPEASAALERGLGELGFPMTAIRRFLVTHAHRDHYTHAARLRERYGVPVTLGVGDRPYLTAIQDGSGPARRLAQLHRYGADALRDTHGLPTGTAAERAALAADWADPDDWLRAPAEIRLAERTLRAIPTPGHTRGHVVFVDDEAGVLFAGDHVLPLITPSIGFEPDPSPQPLGDYLDSLRLVARLPDMMLLPGHGPVRPGFHDRVAELLAHHDERLGLARTAVVDGAAATVLEIARELPWTPRRRRFADLDVANQMLALIETAAHVDLLVALGDLAAADVDGVRRYRAPEVP